MTTVPPSLDPLWLSKSDLKRAHWCLNAFIAHRQGLIPRDGAPNSRSAQLMADGITFDVAARRTLVEQSERQLAEGHDFTGAAHAWFNEQVLVNPELRFFGIPDAVVNRQGVLIPVEIKNRGRALRTDMIDLAFYWLLLDPLRDGLLYPTCGYLILQEDGQPKEPELRRLPACAFEYVVELAAECRQAIEEEQPVRWCNCWLCSQIPREQLDPLRGTARVKELRWVGTKRADALTEAGFVTISDLVDAPPQRVDMPGRRGMSAAFFTKLQDNARVFLEGKPRPLTTEVRPLPEQYVALDLEYTVQGLIWMATLRTVGTGADERITLHAAGPTEHLLLAELVAFLDRHADLPVITWGGTKADLPRLNAALDTTDFLADRHVDMVPWLDEHYRFPCKSIGLKDMTEFFALPQFEGEVTNGLIANYYWGRLMEGYEDDVQPLVDYNRADVDQMVTLVDVLRHLDDQGFTPSPLTPLARDILRDFHAETGGSRHVEEL